MADLVVDYTALSQSRDDLARIHTAFTQATDYARTDQGIWGHVRIEQAMDAFVNSWKLRRGKLADEIQRVHDLTEECMTTFQQGDTDLASTLKGKC